MVASNLLDIHFTAGNRSVLDLKFRAVVAAQKSEDETMSDFIKRAVIERFDVEENQQQEISAAQKVRQELMERISNLEGRIQAGYIPRENMISEPQEVKKNDKISKLSGAW